MKLDTITVPVAVEFVTKDSGQRENLANGMVRDTTEGKTDYTLVLDGPLIERYAQLLTRGAAKYGKRNWCKAFASTDKTAREATKERFRESAFRHFMQWINGDRSEDHAAAVIFNMNGLEAMLATDSIVDKIDAFVVDATAALAEVKPADFKIGDRVRDTGDSETGVITEIAPEAQNPYRVRMDGSRKSWWYRRGELEVV